MATRIPNPAIQHFDIDTKAPLSGGQMFFFEPNGSTTPKDTFNDVDGTIANTNPVILDANGFEPDIFGEGSYRVVLQNSDSVQQWERDPVDFESQTGAFSDWLATVNYSQNDIVLGSDGNFYVSIQNNNTNNDPVSSPDFWTLFYLYKRWNPNETYPIGEVVLSLEGKTYEAIIASLNVDPDTDTANTNWKQFDNLRIDDSSIFSALTGNAVDFANPMVIAASADMDITAIATMDLVGTDIILTSNVGVITLDSVADLTLNSGSGNVIETGDAITIAADTGLLSLSSSTGNFLLNAESGTISSDTTNIVVTTNTAFDVTATTDINLNATENINLTSTLNTVVNAVDIQLDNSGDLTSNGEPIALSQVSVQVFGTAGAGTWIKPTGVKYIQVEAVGGGGGGGSNSANAGPLAGQGGGAGAYIRTFFNVQSVVSVALTVGAGGVGGTVTNGANGAASVFDVASAGGAFGGQGGANAPAANGGTASGAAINTDGGDGAVGIRNASPNGGQGGASYFGGGGLGTLGAANGNPGRARGSGGGGASNTAAVALIGGDGQDGIIIVTEFR